MKSADNRNRVSNSVKEVRITKSDMTCSLGDLMANVFRHHVLLNNSKLTSVDWHNRAVPTEMFAPSARLGITDNTT